MQRCSSWSSQIAAGCSSTVVALAGHDPLFDEGRNHAQRLAEDGVTVETRIAADLVHGYFGLGEASPRCDEEIAAVSAMIRDLAHRPLE